MKLLNWVFPDADRKACQDTERNWLSEVHSPSRDNRGSDLSGHQKAMTEQAHSLPGEGRAIDLSEHRKKATEQGALTN